MRSGTMDGQQPTSNLRGAMMSNLCQVCKTNLAICEVIKNGKRTFKCEACRERRALTLPKMPTIRRIMRTRR